MSEAGGTGNIIDLNAYRASRAAAGTTQAPAARTASYVLWYPGTGVAWVMQSSPARAAQLASHRKRSAPLPEGA